MTETAQPSRTFRLPPEAMELLREIREDGVVAGQAEAVRLALPSELTPEEINDLGLQVSNEVERTNPSRDGYSHGRKAEQQVVFSLGAAALLRGDIQTTKSAITHLRKNQERVGAIILWLESRKRRPASSRYSGV